MSRRPEYSLHDMYNGGSSSYSVRKLESVEKEAAWEVKALTVSWTLEPQAMPMGKLLLSWA